jgi:hypothetical protein
MNILLSDQIMLRMGREKVHHHHNIGLKEVFNYLQATHTHTQNSLSLSLLLPTLHSATGKDVEEAGHVFFFFFPPEGGGAAFFSRAMK